MKIIKYLIILISININATEADKYFGDWKVASITKNDSYTIIASTGNDSHSSAGFMCVVNLQEKPKEKICVPFILNNLACEIDTTYPALFSTDSGAQGVELSCLIFGEKYFLIPPMNHEEYMITNNKYSVVYGTGGRTRIC